MFDDKLCVRCYACTEVCPTTAIDNVAPRLARYFSPRPDVLASLTSLASLTPLRPTLPRLLAR